MKAKYDDIVSLLKYVTAVHNDLYNSLKYEVSTGSSDPEALDEFCEACDDQQASGEVSICAMKAKRSIQVKRRTVKLLPASTTTTETDTSCCSLMSLSPVTPVQAGAASCHQGFMARTRRQLSLQPSTTGVSEKENSSHTQTPLRNLFTD